MPPRIAARPLALCALLAGCEPFFVCPDDSPAAASELPDRLTATGLYAEDGETIADGLLPYRPRFELWTDGADKRRWAQIPEGTTIDTGDVDAWVFPIGSRFWKEFSRDGRPIETRLIERREDGWASVSYVWDQGDAFAAPQGFVDAGGTDHNVPAAAECEVCHGGRRSYVLGFSAVQLADTAELSLADLAARGLLSEDPGALPEAPGSDTQRAALGYLHANCSHCHNAEPTQGPCFRPDNDIDFTLPARPGDEPPALATSGAFVERGNPEDSSVIERMETRDFIYRMPPVGSEKRDRAGIEVIRRWISEL